MRDDETLRAPIFSSRTAAGEGGQGDDDGGHALRVILDTAELISNRAARLSTSMTEGIRTGEALGSVARQIRTLSTNTSLEASRLGSGETVAEIARQMRLLAQQVTAMSEQISTSMRLQNVALGELSSAMDALLADASTVQASLAHVNERQRQNTSILERGSTRGRQGSGGR